MTTRTSKRTVTFRRPFVLASFDKELPAGDYEVETDEELLEGLSFPAYRGTLTQLRLHRKPGRSNFAQFLTIDPNELDAALERERAAAATDETDTAPSGGRELHLDEVMPDSVERSVV